MLDLFGLEQFPQGAFGRFGIAQLVLERLSDAHQRPDRDRSRGRVGSQDVAHKKVSLVELIPIFGDREPDEDVSMRFLPLPLGKGFEGVRQGLVGASGAQGVEDVPVGAGHGVGIADRPATLGDDDMKADLPLERDRHPSFHGLPIEKDRGLPLGRPAGESSPDRNSRIDPIPEAQEPLHRKKVRVGEEEPSRRVLGSDPCDPVPSRGLFLGFQLFGQKGDRSCPDPRMPEAEHRESFLGLEFRAFGQKALTGHGHQERSVAIDGQQLAQVAQIGGIGRGGEDHRQRRIASELGAQIFGEPPAGRLGEGTGIGCGHRTRSIHREIIRFFGSLSMP